MDENKKKFVYLALHASGGFFLLIGALCLFIPSVATLLELNAETSQIFGTALLAIGVTDIVIAEKAFGKNGIKK